MVVLHLLSSCAWYHAHHSVKVVAKDINEILDGNLEILEHYGPLFIGTGCSGVDAWDKNFSKVLIELFEQRRNITSPPFDHMLAQVFTCDKGDVPTEWIFKDPSKKDVPHFPNICGLWKKIATDQRTGSDMHVITPKVTVISSTCIDICNNNANRAQELNCVHKVLMDIDWKNPGNSFEKKYDLKNPKVSGKTGVTMVTAMIYACINRVILMGGAVQGAYPS